MPIPEDPQVFKCFKHDITFDSKAKMEDHCEKFEHIMMNNTVCSRCGADRVTNNTSMKLGKDKRLKAPTYCKNCRKEILKESEEVE